MRHFCLLLSALTLCLSCAAAAPSKSAPAAPQLNIILILADDLSVSDIAAYGGNSYATPEINRLAAEGVRFDNMHSQPLCTPSRVKLMTGQYNYRNYDAFAHLRPSAVTFGNVLQDHGYETMVAGKWQLYRHKQSSPDLVGLLPDGAGFDEHFLWQVYPEARGSRYWAPIFQDNGTLRTYDETAFGPSLINDKVLDFIDRKQKEPFFVYYPMVLPHSPFVTTPDDLQAVTDQEKYAAMIAYTDKLVGNVRKQIERLGLAERTIIIFAADNGTNTRIKSVHNGQEVHGQKGKTTHGATHVPFIAWGGPVVRGRTVADLANFNDVLPTLAEMSGSPVPAEIVLDGNSLTQLLQGQVSHTREATFIHYDPRFAPYQGARYAFDQRWKLYESGAFYDLRNDPLEQSNLDGEIPDSARAAHERLQSVLARHARD